jgi:hypothetical protein
MGQSSHSKLSRAAPFLWICALVFFLFAEGCAVAVEKNRLAMLPFMRRWSLSVVLITPLIVGYSFAVILRKSSNTADSREIATSASAYIAILVIMAYTLLAGTISIF